MHFLVFSITAIILTLPLSPILSEIGLSVCPIMRGHGFIFGCNINAKFVVGLLGLNLLLGNGTLFLKKKVPMRGILGIEPSVLLSLLFLVVSSLGMYAVHSLAIGSIGDAGSPYGHQIGAILLSVGAAIVFSLVALIDYLNLLNSRETATPLESKISEVWNYFLLVGAPFLVLSGFFYFSMTLFDSEIEGWSTLESQKPKLIWAAIVFAIWYLIYFFLLHLSKTRVVMRLVNQALSLKEPESNETMELSRTAELLPVAEALNSARRILSERTRLMSNFSKFVTDRLIEQVVKTNEVSLDGQHVNAAIIMSDLREFTSISQSLQPQQVVRMLNIYFEDMIRVAHEHNVVVDKFIGDGLLAYVLVEQPQAASSSCESAVRSGLEMIKCLRETNLKLNSEGLPSVKIGLGVHFGDVVLGAMGSRSRMQYTIIGDAVNRTARLEGLCKELDSPMIVSAETYKQLGEELRKKFSGPVAKEVKGISEQVEVYFLRKDSEPI